MSALDKLNLLAPILDCMDSHKVSGALEIAKNYRPKCLSEDQQDEAQALYAAWLLYGLQQQAASTFTPPVGATSIKEDRLSITFGSGGADDASRNDPMGFYARWKALSDKCGRGAIIGGNFYDHGHR